MNREITVEQVPAEVIKAWVIFDMTAKEEEKLTGYYRTSYFVNFDNLRYEFENNKWFVLTMNELELSQNFIRDYQLAKMDNLKFKLGLLKSDLTSKTKEDFESEIEFREITRNYAKQCIAEMQSN